MSRSLTGVEERNSFHSCDRIVVLGQPGRDSARRVRLCTTRFHCAPLNGAVLSACQHRYHSEVSIQFKFNKSKGLAEHISDNGVILEYFTGEFSDFLII